MLAIEKEGENHEWTRMNTNEGSALLTFPSFMRPGMGNASLVGRFKVTRLGLGGGAGRRVFEFGEADAFAVAALFDAAAEVFAELACAVDGFDVEGGAVLKCRNVYGFDFWFLCFLDVSRWLSVCCV